MSCACPCCCCWQVWPLWTQPLTRPPSFRTPPLRMGCCRWRLNWCSRPACVTTASFSTTPRRRTDAATLLPSFSRTDTSSSASTLDQARNTLVLLSTIVSWWLCGYHTQGRIRWVPLRHWLRSESGPYDSWLTLFFVHCQSASTLARVRTQALLFLVDMVYFLHCQRLMWDKM